jgi:hypothetical protein
MVKQNRKSLQKATALSSFRPAGIEVVFAVLSFAFLIFS